MLADEKILQAALIDTRAVFFSFLPTALTSRFAQVAKTLSLGGGGLKELGKGANCFGARFRSEHKEFILNKRRNTGKRVMIMGWNRHTVRYCFQRSIRIHM